MANEMLDHPVKLPPVSLEMREKLRAGFPDEAYKAHENKTYLTTLKAAYVMERLNDVFGIGRWTLNHKVEIAENGYVLMSGRLETLDYDCHIPRQYGGHKTQGTGVELADGYKSAITDILSKSASYLEIGIEMFKGNISPSGDKNQQGKPKAKDGGTLTKEQVPEFYKSWNGKIYKGGTVYWNDLRYKLTDDQVDWLQGKDKYRES